MSTYLTVLAALGMTALNMLLNRLLVNKKKLMRLREEMKQYEKLLKKAMKARDEKTRFKMERKLRKRMAHFDQVRSELMWEQSKAFVSLIVSLFIFLFILMPYFDQSRTIAYLPIGLRGPIRLNFVFWYMICGLAFGTLIQRAFGISLTE
ncbi:hypothetical protein DRO32_02265 [Candidatus Bathyarchaeota archaeon]|nr:MAG: hypothetical protein DRO32_02265 [Candidatus Bathyarchaeota archaeon]